MAAYFDTGFSVRQPMWHSGGMILDDYPADWQDARQKAGLLWEPAVRETYQRKPIESVNGNIPDGALFVTSNEILIPLADHKLIVRDDNEDVLGVVGRGFELVYHSQMGEIIETILGLDNVKFETAGSCRNGGQVWALAYLDEPCVIAGDNTMTYPFLALLNSHDGQGACKLVRTSVRVVCWNTYNMASLEGQRTGQEFTFRHTANIHERLEEAQRALAGMRSEMHEWEELANDLFGVEADEVAFAHFVQDFIPEPAAEIVSDRVRDNIAKARKLFKNIYLDSVTTEAHRGTALGLVDASVEYLDHVRGFRNQETYLNRTLLRPEPLKARAVKLAREVCSV